MLRFYAPTDSRITNPTPPALAELFRGSLAASFLHGFFTSSYALGRLMFIGTVGAAQLVKETRLLVGEIAQQVSYDNQLHFSRAFRNVHGVSLREYRQTHFFALPREASQDN